MEGWERAREHFVACRGKFVIHEREREREREREAQYINISATLGEWDDRLVAPQSICSLLHVFPRAIQSVSLRKD